MRKSLGMFMFFLPFILLFLSLLFLVDADAIFKAFGSVIVIVAVVVVCVKIGSKLYFDDEVKDD